MVRPPKTLSALLSRAHQLHGLQVGQIAAHFGIPLDTLEQRHKGQLGVLMERALGATAGNLDLPDFTELGVELKTIPVDARGRVTESTFVCTIEPAAADHEPWETSRLWRKLKQVLWVPVETGPPLLERRVGPPLLWQPNASERSALKSDWQWLIGKIAIGAVDDLDGSCGRVLQVRPKASDGSVRSRVLMPDGRRAEFLPRGFYLRPSFTEQILERLAL